jgi:4-phospho-D-threonate 3-dehydrogenase / 4-phospho-D-erythronate 3-dehydrogenase
MMTTSQGPLIAITLGDAAGIGPEVVAKAVSEKSIYSICRPLVVGELVTLQKALDLVQSPLKIHTVSAAAEMVSRFGTLDLLDMHNLDQKEVLTGHISPACGKAAVEFILKAAQMAIQGEVDALVTAPINKEATRLAGYGELGHMELLERYTGVKESATMLASGRLRVVHLTTHHSLKDALGYVTRERILARLALIQKSFAGWGIQQARIAVAALNPHGGEGGILGDEEIREIIPAVETAKSLGIDARGPYPADTVFNRAIRGEFDVVLALYHDQGHIPIKIYGFEKSVSVALGLPFIRTSVDHGTAFDIAGKGIAEAESMLEAIRVAVSLSRDKKL